MRLKKRRKAMIKGVAKSIIEINPRKGTDSFEKAIIILNSACTDEDISKLSTDIFLQLENRPPEYLKIKKKSAVIKTIIAFVCGMFLSALLCYAASAFV